MPHIDNLYKSQEILLFKECFCLEKIHGTNTRIVFNPADNTIQFSSGGEPHARFVALFDQEALLTQFKAMSLPVDRPCVVYGEAYGGSQQGMSDTYGKELKFIAFAVKIGDCWLSVPDAAKVCSDLCFEFVHYVRTTTELKDLDAQRDAPSVQAIRNKVSSANPDGSINNPRPREGVVILPLKEFTLNNGNRVIVKHKTEKFRETATPREVTDPAKLQVLADAEAVGNEWVTSNRLEHILQGFPNHDMTKMGEILKAMVEDVLREGAGEIVDSKEVRKAISGKTAKMYKGLLESNLRSQNP